MTDKTKAVLQFLKDNAQNDYTAEDVGIALGLTTKQVNGIFTQGIAKAGKDLGVRVEAQMVLPDGTEKTVKLLKLTEKGLQFDPDVDDK